MVNQISIIIMCFFFASCGVREEGSALKADLIAITYNLLHPNVDVYPTMAVSDRADQQVDFFLNTTQNAPAVAIFSQENYPQFDQGMGQHFQRVEMPANGGRTYTKMYVDKNSSVKSSEFVPFDNQGGVFERVLRKTGSHVVRVNDVDGKERIFINTHLPSLSTSREARSMAQTQILNQVEALRRDNPDADIVVGGDFNVATKDLRNRFKAIGGLSMNDDANTWSNRNPIHSEDQSVEEAGRIDDLFVVPSNSSTKVTGGAVDNSQQKISDHNPVIMNVPDLSAADSRESGHITQNSNLDQPVSEQKVELDSLPEPITGLDIGPVITQMSSQTTIQKDQ